MEEEGRGRNTVHGGPSGCTPYLVDIKLRVAFFQFLVGNPMSAGCIVTWLLFWCQQKVVYSLMDQPVDEVRKRAAVPLSESGERFCRHRSGRNQNWSDYLVEVEKMTSNLTSIVASPQTRRKRRQRGKGETKRRQSLRNCGLSQGYLGFQITHHRLQFSVDSRQLYRWKGVNRKEGGLLRWE